MSVKMIAATLVIIAFVGAAYYATTLVDTTDPEVVTQSEIKKFASEEDLRDHLTSSQDYFGGGFYARDTLAVAETATIASAGDEGSAAPVASQDYSDTNVQVEGVDEADIVKTDGEHIYVLSGNKISILKAVPAEDMEVVSEIGIEDASLGNIFIEGDRLVVFGSSYGHRTPVDSVGIVAPGYFPRYYQPTSFVYVYDVSDRSEPEVERNVTVDGSYVDSRMIGSQLYAIFNTHAGSADDLIMPVIAADGAETRIAATDVYYFPVPYPYNSFTSVISMDVEGGTGDEVTSSVMLSGAGQNIYVSENNIYIVHQNSVNYMDLAFRLVEGVMIPNVPQEVADDMRKVLDVSDSGLSKAEKFSAASQIFYKHLSRMDDEERSRVQKIVEEESEKIQIEVEEESQKTVVHRISIDGDIEYQATAKVRGTVLNQFSMDEHDDHFRIATTTSSWRNVPRPLNIETTEAAEPEEQAIENARSLNHIYVLDMGLNEVGKLENLAPNERIYSARFIGDRAYMVTFRQVDPFFVIDMSDPTQPKVLGELKIPGFSNYLHPYDDDHVIGVGKSTETTEWGAVVPTNVKIALFDVTDVSNPVELDSYEVSGERSDSEALWDHKAFLFSKEKGIISMPMSVYNKDYSSSFQGAYVISIDLDGIEFKGSVSHQKEDERYGGYVRRSLYIGDVLYTVSDSLVKSNSLDDISEISSVEIDAGYDYPIAYGGIIEDVVAIAA